MRAPAFWRETRGRRRGCSRPLGAIYGAVAARRMSPAGRARGVPVLCVGNFTAGGAGKTPTAIALARRCRRSAGGRPSCRAAMAARVRGPIRVDLSRHTPPLIGDEPLLLARHAPTVVSPRPRGGREARRGAGRRHRHGRRPAEPVARQGSAHRRRGRRSTGSATGAAFRPARCARRWPAARPGRRRAGDRRRPHPARRSRRGARRGARPCCQRGPDAGSARRSRRCAATRFSAFAGIGRPDKMFDTLRDGRRRLWREQRAFPDHHRFTRADAAALLG